MKQDKYDMDELTGLTQKRMAWCAALIFLIPVVTVLVSLVIVYKVTQP